MAPCLRVSAGPNVTELETVAVNHDNLPVSISSQHFQGRIVVRIKDFHGESPPNVETKSDCQYFHQGHGVGMSWSIQIQGRFLSKINADDLVFGNTFDKPIKDKLPYGTSLALQFFKVIDPNLYHDLYGEKPWAFSPLLATMNRISIIPYPSETSLPPFPTTHIQEDVTPLLLLTDDIESDQLNMKSEHDNRRHWFSVSQNRQKVFLDSNFLIHADFFNSFIDFNDLSLAIPFSGGLKFDLKKYWDGQPIRYVCKDQKSDTVFFVIQFDIVDLDS